MVTTQEIREYEAEARHANKTQTRYLPKDKMSIFDIREKEIEPQQISHLGRRNTLVFLQNASYGDIISRYLSYGDMHRAYCALYFNWHPSLNKVVATCLKYSDGKRFISTQKSKQKIPKVDFSMFIGFEDH